MKERAQQFKLSASSLALATHDGIGRASWGHRIHGLVWGDHKPMVSGRGAGRRRSAILEACNRCNRLPLRSSRLLPQLRSVAFPPHCARGIRCPSRRCRNAKRWDFAPWRRLRMPRIASAKRVNVGGGVVRLPQWSAAMRDSRVFTSRRRRCVRGMQFPTTRLRFRIFFGGMAFAARSSRNTSIRHCVVPFGRLIFSLTLPGRKTMCWYTGACIHRG